MAKVVITATNPEFTTTIRKSSKLSSRFDLVSPGKVFIGGRPSFRRASATPFKVQFRTSVVESYGPNSPAPVGVAIIGYSNYIL